MSWLLVGVAAGAGIVTTETDSGGCLTGAAGFVVVGGAPPLSGPGALPAEGEPAALVYWCEPVTANLVLPAMLPARVTVPGSLVTPSPQLIETVKSLTLPEALPSRNVPSGTLVSTWPSAAVTGIAVGPLSAA